MRRLRAQRHGALSADASFVRDVHFVKKERRLNVAFTLTRTRNALSKRGSVQDSMPPRMKRKKLVPDVKQESRFPQVHERRRQKS